MFFFASIGVFYCEFWSLFGTKTFFGGKKKLFKYFFYKSNDPKTSNIVKRSLVVTKKSDSKFHFWVYQKCKKTRA
jgi:hypothetical protein